MIIYPKTLEDLLGEEKLEDMDRISFHCDLSELQEYFAINMNPYYTFLKTLVPVLIENFPDMVQKDQDYPDSIFNLLITTHSPIYEAARNIVHHNYGFHNEYETFEDFNVDMIIGETVIFDVYRKGIGFDVEKTLKRYFSRKIIYFFNENRGWGFAKYHYSNGLKVTFSEDGVHTYIMADRDHLENKVPYPFLTDTEIKLSKKEGTNRAPSLCYNPHRKPNKLEKWWFLSRMLQKG